jgi:hypothetical protein
LADASNDRIGHNNSVSDIQDALGQGIALTTVALMIEAAIQGKTVVEPWAWILLGDIRRLNMQGKSAVAAYKMVFEEPSKPGANATGRLVCCIP